MIAATASEAPHVLDGLLYHQTGLQIEEHYTDTGGVTDHVFGLCHLFGFRFAPRIRDLKDRRLYVFPDAAQPARLQPIIAGTINVDHVKVHWDELLRLAVSIRSGTSSASAMLKRLSAYPRQNGLAVGDDLLALWVTLRQQRQTPPQVDEGLSWRSLRASICHHPLRDPHMCHGLRCLRL